MVSFSNDVDILKYEPILFGELHLPWQVLAAGTDGTLSGTTFTANNVDFINAQVSTGGVIYMQSKDGSLDGAYEIVTVDSPTQLTVSVLRPDSQTNAVAPPTASDISWRISTFAPQTNEAGFRLTEYFGIRPGNPTSDIEVGDILDADVLKQASVFAVISNVYAMLAGKAQDENFRNKSLHYQKLFSGAKERCRLAIDIDSDGLAETVKSSGAGRLVRD
jgi:hypothetical protein